LDKAAKERLDELVPLLKGKPNKIEIRVYAPRKLLAPGSKFADAWELARARSMAVKKCLNDNEIVADRIRLTQEGSLEPDTLYMDDNKRVPGSRVEIFALDEYLDKGRNPVPQTGGLEDEDPR
jgi:hypothetical protein